MTKLDLTPIKDQLARARHLPVFLTEGEIAKARENRKGLYRWHLEGTWDDAVLFGRARDDIAALVAEVERLREDERAFADTLGYGDDITGPAATLAEMVDPILDAFRDQREHDDCPVLCELCGERLADATCEHCHGSGCDNTRSEYAWSECEWCGGVGKIHEGCAETSYANLTAEVERLTAQIDTVKVAVSNHPNPCTIHPDGDPVSCGWKNAYQDVLKALGVTEQ